MISPLDIQRILEPPQVFYLALGIGVGVFLFLLGALTFRIIRGRRIHSAKKNAERIIAEAHRESATLKKETLLEIKDERYRMRADFEKESWERKQELLLLEKRLTQREENLDKKVDLLEKKTQEVDGKEKDIVSRERKVAKVNEELAATMEQQEARLQEISGLTVSEAKRILLEQLEDQVRHEAALKMKQLEEETLEMADKRAKEILSLSIQRCASEYVAESTVSVVSLPSDEMKGRIIGREGRNIRALENATGIDIIVDDTPEAVILSGYDPIRREIARISLERLISDGRIHPARIEEIVDKVHEEMETAVREVGEQAALDAGIHGLHPEETRLIGRLKYRTSYGQNQLQHAKEVAFIVGVMAAELGINSQQAKRAAFLHDIGKAVDQEHEGTHAQIGAELSRKFGESDLIVNAVAAHHGDIETQSVIAVLVQAGDAVSAARPGARRETLETYIKRLEKLERIADSFIGVEKAFAIQAGREIRVIVEPEKLTDGEAAQLAKNVTKKVEAELEYPGQIKVTVIRETRAVEYAN